MRCVHCRLSSDLITFDFSCAFDKVDHKIQCDKLKSAGIDGCYLRWIIDYLGNREQFISNKDSQSKTFALPSRVVQGLCIGPSIFTIFINDLCKVVKYAKPSLFADDFKLTGDVSTQRNCDFMQAVVSTIADWSVANKLPINFEKSVALHYGKAYPRRQYFINRHAIKSEKYVVDLSVCHSETFSYQEHICRITYKAAKIAEMVLSLQYKRY